jgi:hypothetical protein
MASRIENPNADDLGQGGVALTETEFEEFLDALALRGADPQMIDVMRDKGFFAPIERLPVFEWAFKAYKMQDDIKVLAVCRDDKIEAMRNYIIFLCREGTWPGNE